MDWKEILPEIKKYITEFGVHIISAILILLVGFWLTKLITRIFKKILVRRNVDVTLIGFLTFI